MTNGENIVLYTIVYFKGEHLHAWEDVEKSRFNTCNHASEDYQRGFYERKRNDSRGVTQHPSKPKCTKVKV